LHLTLCEKRERHALGHAAENDGHTRDATRRVAPELVDELLRDCRISSRTPSMTSSPLRQVSMRNEMTKAISRGTAVEELGRGRGEEEQVEGQKAAVDRIDDQWIVLPVKRNESRQQRGDHHQQRHGDAERDGQRVRRADDDGGELPAASAQLTKGRLREL
jgi:hypothetical protein